MRLWSDAECKAVPCNRQFYCGYRFAERNRTSAQVREIPGSMNYSLLLLTLTNRHTYLPPSQRPIGIQNLLFTCRALPLVEAITQDFNNQPFCVLASHVCPT